MRPNNLPYATEKGHIRKVKRQKCPYGRFQALHTDTFEETRYLRQNRKY